VRLRESSEGPVRGFKSGWAEVLETASPIVTTVYSGVPWCTVSVSIKVRRGIAELADKMVKYGLARSRNHAFNVLIEKGLAEVKREVEYWESMCRRVEELKKRGFKLSHGGLNKLKLLEVPQRIQGVERELALHDVYMSIER
jgi:hypothetical protein